MDINRSLTESLNSFTASLSDYILQNIKSGNEVVDKCIGKIDFSNGKMLRPIIMYLVYLIQKNKNCDNDVFVNEFGAAIEILHLATLVHDDVIDEAVTRRGVDAINVKEGNRVAILSGDLLFSKSFNIMSSSSFYGAKNIMKIVSEATNKLVIGELMEEKMIFNSDFGIDDYLDIVSKKTTSLFVASALIGNELACNSSESGVVEFAENLGLAFQIYDDFLDYFGKNTGKGNYNDIKQAKITFPIILLKSKINDVEMQKCIDIFGKNNITEADIDIVIGLMDYYTIRTEVISVVEFYISKCKNAIKSLNDTEISEVLMSVIDKIFAN